MMPTEGVTHHSTTEVVYAFIRDYRRVEGFPPSLRDIAEGCDLGLTTVVYHIKRLREWGFITRSPSKARSLLLVDEDKDSRELRQNQLVTARQERRGRKRAARRQAEEHAS